MLMWRKHRAVPAVAIVVLGGLTACGSEDQPSDRGEQRVQAQNNGDETTDISASCAKPMTDVSDATVVAGESIGVSAKGMWEQCLPPGWNTPGVTPGERVPDTDLRVVWRQGSAESVLDTVDADADGVVELSVTIPDDAQPGAADITIATAVSATVTVESAN
ncbi:hypothetical protein CLV30_102202 [Haloactinopolyspora alba]|uniref:Uncharacterized protein n=1 Tax=Haloactinopolyspora alba TaxID=648780 RepID=A0A2P8EBH7_9ACTN|nr:hypothetical protein [Haloactinopolyspora alba]PSL06813.1 hypothetical protein CLV30_102202 [Haloactinopolyspora alba]